MARVLVRLGMHGKRHRKASLNRTAYLDGIVSKWAKRQADKIKAETVELEYLRQVMGL